jgi:hypothetical protein
LAVICKKKVQEEKKRKNKPERYAIRRRARCNNGVSSSMREHTYLATVRQVATID